MLLGQEDGLSEKKRKSNMILSSAPFEGCVYAPASLTSVLWMSPFPNVRLGSPRLAESTTWMGNSSVSHVLHRLHGQCCISCVWFDDPPATPDKRLCWKETHRIEIAKTHPACSGESLPIYLTHLVKSTSWISKHDSLPQRSRNQ